MRKQILIEKNVLSTQIAILQESEFISFYLETCIKSDKQNRIVVGQVEQVVKNLKAVFVNFGEEKNGLLHIKQVPECYQNKLSPGSRLPVQVVKQNSGEKGYKLTGKVNLMGRFLVCLPFETGINISKKIKDQEIREVLKQKLQCLSNGKYGFVVRTTAKNASESLLEKDALELIEKADAFMKAKDYLSKGSQLYEDPPLFMQIVREELEGAEKVEIICNQQSVLSAIQADIGEEDDEEHISFKLCNEIEGLFQVYDIEKKRTQLLNRKIWLKNGGNLVIDYTEAMTVIDVNSAKAILTKNPQKAVLDLNLLAVKESILQMLRRNLSGIIVIDLVEMPSQEDKQYIYEYAKELLNKWGDRRTKVYPLTDLGLLQFSRTKKYIGLPQQLFTSCIQCEAPYSENSLSYYMMELEKTIKDISEKTEHTAVFVEVAPIFYQFLLKNNCIEQLENAYNLQLQIERSTASSKKMFLCQFYQR